MSEEKASWAGFEVKSICFDQIATGERDIEKIWLRYETRCWNVFGILKSIDVTEERVNYERRGCSKALANRVVGVSIGVGRVMNSRFLDNVHGGSNFH